MLIAIMNEPAAKIGEEGLYQRVWTTPIWTKARSLSPEPAHCPASLLQIPTECSVSRRFLAALIALLAFAQALHAAETLYNGIVLPEAWPPAWRISPTIRSRHPISRRRRRSYRLM